MQTIQTKMRVKKNHEGILQLPPSIIIGDYEVMVIIQPKKRVQQPQIAWKFPVDSYGAWPQHVPLRREELYSDWGR
jgi:hypothetical protein